MYVLEATVIGTILFIRLLPSNLFNVLSTFTPSSCVIKRTFSAIRQLLPLLIEYGSLPKVFVSQFRRVV